MMRYGTYRLVQVARGGGSCAGSPRHAWLVTGTTDCIVDCIVCNCELLVHVYVENTKALHLPFVGTRKSRGTRGGGVDIALS